MRQDSPADAWFRIETAPAGPTFLGLPIAERNRRVARRAGGVSHETGSGLPTLSVPAGVAITPNLVRALPRPAGVTELSWHSGQPPLVWSAPDAQDSSPTQQVALPAGSALDVSTAAARHVASWQLLRASGKPSDGWLSRHIHRRISRCVSYVFLRLGLTANIATFLTFGLGALGAWFIAQTSHLTMIVGALLYWGSSIADGIDGEMARLTLSESAFGEQLDTGVDQATHLLALGGAGIGWWRQGVGPGGVALATAVMLGVPAIVLWAMTLVRRARGVRQFFVVTKPIELAVSAAAARTGAIPLRIAAAIFILFRREAFSCAFFVVSLLTGRRVAIPAIVAASLAIVGATFAIYRTELTFALETVAGPSVTPATLTPSR